MTNTVPQRPWFRATRTHGRFTAVPVAWQGWASLVAFVALVALGGVVVLRSLMALLGGLAVIAYLPLLGLALWGFFRFVASKSDITDLRG